MLKTHVFHTLTKMKLASQPSNQSHPEIQRCPRNHCLCCPHQVEHLKHHPNLPHDTGLFIWKNTTTLVALSPSSVLAFSFAMVSMPPHCDSHRNFSPLEGWNQSVITTQASKHTSMCYTAVCKCSFCWCISAMLMIDRPVVLSYIMMCISNAMRSSIYSLIISM